MAIGTIEIESHFMKGTGVTTPNLGKKRTCQSCEARFFDLNKNPAICPKCHDKNKIPTTKARRAAAPGSKAASVKTPKVEDVAETSNAAKTATEPDAGDAEEETDELNAELEEDLDESLMENTSELDEDNDELSEVLAHVDDDAADK
jgi:uncharacterized protein (TIGR02300 family)